MPNSGFIRSQALELQRVVQALFDVFVDRVWGDAPSYHNPDHFEAAVQASERVFAGLTKGHDPLGVQKDLSRWNQLYRTNISLDELEQLVVFAFYGHDVGNFLDISSTHELMSTGGDEVGDCVDGLLSVHLRMLDTFRSAQAEERSQAVVKVIGEVCNLSLTAKEMELVSYLIGQTEFAADELTQPFGALMKVADQLSSGYFRADYMCVQYGLILENLAENPAWEFVPERYFNFTYHRQFLLLGKEALASLLAIWGVEPREYQEGYVAQPVRAADWLEEHGEQEFAGCM